MLLEKSKVSFVLIHGLTHADVRYTGPVKLGDLEFAGYSVSDQAYCELLVLCAVSDDLKRVL